jgi:enediyne biosynthesis protein E4
MPAMRRWGRLLALAAVAGGALYGCWWLSRVWRHRAALVEIREHVQAGRHGIAARNLAELLAWEPRSDEAIYLLCVCENARGRPAAAEVIWARIRPGSAFAVPAILARATFLVDHGRLADAERLIDQALTDPRLDGFDLRRFLAPLYRSEGRIEDALRLIEANWALLNRAGRGGSGQAIELLGQHVAQSTETPTAESVRAFLERVEGQAPDDDRIWLGKANLAIRQSSFDEAARWLDACLRRRPEDAPVWRARLEWAMATGRTAEAREALEHVPADRATPAQVHGLAAWFAARRGDAESERQALERLIAANPGDSAALDRLAELALRNGQATRAAELQSKKAALDPLRSRYKELFVCIQPVRNAMEMTRIAEHLGRFFEARAFATLAVATDPDRDDFRAILARIEQHQTTIAAPGRTLAQLLARGFDAAATPQPQIAPASARDTRRKDAIVVERPRDG